MLLEVAPTFCPKTVEPEYVDSCSPDYKTPSTTCEITYYQQPWLNKNKKNIIANNCTHSQTFSVEITPKKEITNEINPFYNVNPTEDDVMSPLRMKDLESQIMFQKPVEKMTTTTESTLSDSQKAAIDDLLDMMNEELYHKRPEEEPSDSFEGRMDPVRNKRGIPGAPIDADPKDPKTKEYVHTFLKPGM